MIVPSRKPRASAVVNHHWLPYSTPSFVPQVVFYGASPSGRLATSPSSAERYATVKQLAAEYNDIFTEGALRNLIWHAEAHARSPKPGARSNGFLTVIHRPGGGRKVLLDRVTFAHWLSNGKNAEVCNG